MTQHIQKEVWLIAGMQTKLLYRNWMAHNNILPLHSPKDTLSDVVECLIQVHKTYVDLMGKRPASWHRQHNKRVGSPEEVTELLGSQIVPLCLHQGRRVLLHPSFQSVLSTSWSLYPSPSPLSAASQAPRDALVGTCQGFGGPLLLLIGHLFACLTHTFTKWFSFN